MEPLGHLLFLSTTALVLLIGGGFRSSSCYFSISVELLNYLEAVPAIPLSREIESRQSIREQLCLRRKTIKESTLHAAANHLTTSG